VIMQMRNSIQQEIGHPRRKRRRGSAEWPSLSLVLESVSRVQSEVSPVGSYAGRASLDTLHVAFQSMNRGSQMTSKELPKIIDEILDEMAKEADAKLSEIAEEHGVPITKVRNEFLKYFNDAEARKTA